MPTKEYLETHVQVAIPREARDWLLKRSGTKRVLIERTLKPGLREDAIVEPLIRAEPLEISDVFKRPLGRFKDMDAKSAGYPDLETFKEDWIEKYKTEWNPQEIVYVVLFK